MVPWRYRPNILFAISDLLPYGSLNLKWGCYWVPSSFPFLRFHFHRPHPYSKWVKNWKKNSEINLWWIESTYNELQTDTNQKLNSLHHIISTLFLDFNSLFVVWIQRHFHYFSTGCIPSYWCCHHLCRPIVVYNPCRKCHPAKKWYIINIINTMFTFLFFTESKPYVSNVKIKVFETLVNPNT